jgi:DNA repair exonuclease SbcCD ATPase subunit
MSFRKVRAERKIKKLSKQLEELEQAENPDLIRPIEKAESTMVIRSRDQRKAELKEQIAKYEQILMEAGQETQARSAEERKAQLEKRMQEVQQELEDLEQEQEKALETRLDSGESTMIVQTGNERRDELREEMEYCKQAIQDCEKAIASQS